MKQTTTTLANCLVYNNRFATAKLDAEQLGAETFDDWKKLIVNLHRSAYAVYAQCENGGMKTTDAIVDKTAIFDCIRVILNAIGEVNGHKLYANEESAVAIVSYAGRRANLDSPEVQLVNSRIANAKKEIKLAEGMNGLNADYIENLEKRLEDLEDEKEKLLATADMRIKKPTMTSTSAFRLDVEHFFARTIVGQMAKTLEQLDAEDEARKQARKAAAKARKAKKAAEQAK